MRLGERYLNDGIGGKYRCRAILKNGEQCKCRALTSISFVAVCIRHKKSLKPGVEFYYVELPCAKMP